MAASSISVLIVIRSSEVIKIVHNPWSNIHTGNIDTIRATRSTFAHCPTNHKITSCESPKPVNTIHNVNNILLAAKGTSKIYKALCNESSLGIRTVICDCLYNTNRSTKYMINTIVALAAARNHARLVYQIHTNITSGLADKKPIKRSIFCISAKDMVPNI